MYEKEFHIAALIAAHLKQELNEEQALELHQWIRASEANAKLFKELSDELLLKPKLATYRSKNISAVWTKTTRLIQQSKNKKVNRSTKQPLWNMLAGAAALVLAIIGLYIYFYRLYTDSWRENGDVITYISPGKVGAMLTLADGRQIALDTLATGLSELENGLVLNKSKEGELLYEIKGSSKISNQKNILSTAKGQTYMVRLPDKSKVWLNASSTLIYTTDLNSVDIRHVKLEGEGYFEISKDEARPFIVETEKQEIQVMGTHFNVNSYNDEPASLTTLMEGAVRIKTNNFEQVLNVGEQATTKDGTTHVNVVDVESVLDWKNGDFNFDQVDFKVAMRKIARWYNVEVIYDKSLPKDLQTGGWVARSSNLADVLKVIESSGLVHFKIEGRTLYVYK